MENEKILDVQQAGYIVNLQSGAHGVSHYGRPKDPETGSETLDSRFFITDVPSIAASD